jgi:cbb3-type cytochrome oxidase subunit 3
MNQQATDGKMAAVGFFQGERWLVVTGLLGMLLAAGCAVWVLLFGGPVAPGGDVSKAFSFNAAFGMFLFSTAGVIPFAAMGAKSRAFFRWSYIVLALYAYAAENVQNFRGVDPRFVHNGTSFDTAVSIGFAFVALLLVLVYLFLAVQFSRKRAAAQRPELVLGIRYAMIATLLSFAAGIWMSVGQGRFTGAHGNIIWLHGLGFHALQALPFVAWLAERTSLSVALRRGSIHLAGIAYLLGLAAIGWQTLLGRAVTAWTPLPVAAGACFLISIGIGAWMLRKAIKTPAAQQSALLP